MGPTRTLLLDGDILAFRSVAANFHETEWAPDIWSYWVDMGAAKDAMVSQVERLAHDTRADDVLICITGAGETFRHRLWPAYKGHRKPKPPGYRAFQDWLQERFKVYLRPGLEADDSLGILMTADDIVPGHKVLWSADKDLRQIPGDHWDGEQMHRVTQDEGDLFHAYQTLIGDVTDNYPGCPGVGPETARAALKDCSGPVSYRHTFKTGPRKGKSEERFETKPFRARWSAIGAHYARAGLTVEDMLVQARVARILTADLYDFDLKQPLMWSPPPC